MDHAVDEGFLRAAHRDTMVLASTPEEALAAIDAFVPLKKSKWVDAPKP